MDNDTTTQKTDSDEFDRTIRLAVDTFGRESQTQKLFEEMAELQEALCKFVRGRDTADHVCEEIADLMIMCQQMAVIYGPARVEEWGRYKMTRLRTLLAQVNGTNKQS